MKYEKSCGCIVIYENKVLLVQHNEGHWDFPKGHMEENETEVETAIREVKEETNIDVLIQENRRYVNEYFPKEDTFKQVVFFLATCKEKETKKQEAEIQNIEWLTFEEALERITHKDSKNLLKKVMEDIKYYKESEYWDVYDENRKKTNKIHKRNEKLNDGEYHLVVDAIILNSKNEILISRRSAYKKFAFMWECAGGAVLKGETSLEGMIRELKEELGIEVTAKDAMILKTIKSENKHNFKDLWVFKKDIDISKLTFEDGEAFDAMWVSIDKFINMFENKEIVPSVDVGIEEYTKAINLKQNENYEYIGKILKTKIDRPVGSKHPKHGFIYPVNYGYIPNTISGDGEELDCYILGVFEPVEEFTGKCIGLIHRTNDNDDKLIIVPEEKDFTSEQIRALTEFQEQYFESEIIK